MMELVIKSADDAAPIWHHFLLNTSEISIKYFDDANRTGEEKLVEVQGQYRWDINDHIITIDLMIYSVFRYNGIDYPLLKILQRFNVVKENSRATGIVPVRWQKLSPDQTTGVTKIVPPLHPLLQFNAGTVTVVVKFVDITQLFNRIHGDTPWFMAMELLRGTERTIRVLASIMGHPFIWYVVIPNSAAGEQDLQPTLLYLPKDYGGIDYDSASITGITTPNHDTSVGDIQCGGETLFMFLTMPVSDSDYDSKLESYLRLSDKFKSRNGRNPPPLHHFREVLSYEPKVDSLEPRYWDIPFGFEQAISERKQVLLVPQINGADGGIAIKNGLKSLVENALMLIYTQGSTLYYDTVSVNNLILVCFSQSGGNMFTACNRNLTEIKALVCFEPQYLNKHLKGEDRNLTLGKDVIPKLIEQNGKKKVAIVGRYKNIVGFEKDKYFLSKTDPADLVLLPDNENFFILEYPYNAKAVQYDYAEDEDGNVIYVPSTVLALRYSRLLKNLQDHVISDMLSKDTDVDFASARTEGRVEEIIMKYRKAGFSDERMIRQVFVPDYNIEGPGGFYSHNFIISSGQEIADDGHSVKTKFFNQALSLTSSSS